MNDDMYEMNLNLNTVMDALSIRAGRIFLEIASTLFNFAVVEVRR